MRSAGLVHMKGFAVLIVLANVGGDGVFEIGERI